MAKNIRIHNDGGKLQLDFISFGLNKSRIIKFQPIDNTYEYAVYKVVGMDGLDFSLEYERSYPSCELDQAIVYCTVMTT